MTSRLVALRLDAGQPGPLAQFWAELLGRDQHGDDGCVTVPGDDGQVSLQFVASPGPRQGPGRVHLHLTSASEDEQRRTVATALRLGARQVDVGQRPDEAHIVLADPDGGEFCVIEAGNRFLAGCGRLGELACDGTREVGLFWSTALDWPLVWDLNQETAIQSPHGGTKIAWGGPPVAPLTRSRRQRLLLAPAGHDQQTELDRLVTLGATRLHPGPDGSAVLADPDGNEFVMLRHEVRSPE